MFEIGNGYQSNEVVLNYVASTNSLTFNSYRTSFTTPSDLLLVSGVQASTWYHLMVTLSTGTSSSSASSAATAYVNGRQVGGSISNAVFPAALTRTRAWLGRSDWPGEGNLTALIDAFRVYDYVVPTQTVASLYNLSSYGLPPVPPVTPGNFYQYQSGPQLAYTLDTAPPSNELNFNSNYSWTASSTAYPNPDGTMTPHSGVGQFNGIYQLGHSIDMTAYPDSLGRTFNFPIGGSLSFETWHLFYSPLRTSLPNTLANGYDYVFSFGGTIGQNSNNLGLTTIGWGAQLMYVDYLNATTQHVTDTAGTIVVATPGVWQYMVLSLQQLNPAVTSGTGAANCTVFISGKPVYSMLCNVPQWVARPNGYLARSPDDVNLRHWGEIDAFYLYNYALSAEAVAAHYVLPRAPLMEVVFDRDPQAVTSRTTSAYSWTTAVGSHSGVLALSSASSQYVDLSTYTGANSIGTTLPTSAFTAAGAGVTQTQFGWGVEMTFFVSSTSSTPNMVLLDIGTASAGTDEILLQFTPNACSIQLVAYGGSAGTTAVTVPTSACITPGFWYSVIFTASMASATATTATYQGFVNGVASGSAVSGAVIRSAVRTVGYIGKSIGASSATAGTLPFNGYVDSIRLMDVALTATQVFTVANLTNPPTSPMSSSGGSAYNPTSTAYSPTSPTGRAPSVTSSVPLSPTSVNVFTSVSAASVTSPAVTPPASSSSSSGLSSGAIAGIVIGAVIGGLVLLCALWFFCAAACRGGKAKSTGGEPSHAHDEFHDNASTHQNNTDDEVEMQGMEGEGGNTA